MTTTRRTARQLTTMTVALIACTTAIGWISTLSAWSVTVDPPGTATGVLWGAATGLAASAVISVHHGVRVFFGRTPEGEPLVDARTPERRRAISAAAEHTLADTTSVFAVVALASAFSGGLVARALPAAGLVVVLVILAVRLRASRGTST